MRLIACVAISLILSACASSTPTADPNLTPAPLTGGWQYLSFTDPALEVGVPMDWGTQDPTQTTDPAALGSMSPQQQTSTTWFNDMASSGKLRLNATGKVETPIETLDGGYITAIVESGDGSLNAFGDREVALDKTLGAVSIDRQNVVLPAGPAIRLSFSGTQADESSKWVEDDYLFTLPDGRSLTIGVGGSGPADVATSVSDFAAKVVATLRPAPKLIGYRSPSPHVPFAQVLPATK